MKMIDAFTTCLTGFNKRFESQNNSTQSFRDITPNARAVWVKRSCISITTCPCINTSYTLWLWLVVSFLLSFQHGLKIVLVCFFTLNVYMFFYQSLLVFLVSKIQINIKSRKSKKFDRRYCVLSQACFALYLCTNGFMHLRA